MSKKTKILAFIGILMMNVSCNRANNKFEKIHNKKIDSLLVEFLSDTNRPFYHHFRYSDLPINKQLNLSKTVSYPEIDLTLLFYNPSDSHLFTEVVICYDSINCVLIPFYLESFVNKESKCKCTLVSLNKDINSALETFAYKKDDFHLSYGLDFQKVFIHGLFSNISKISSVISYPYYTNQNDIDYIINNTKSSLEDEVDTVAIKKMTLELLKKENIFYSNVYYFKDINLIYLVEYLENSVNIRAINTENYSSPIIF